jgi:signal transduction histidine kinase
MSNYNPKELLRPAFPGLEESDLVELSSVAEIHSYPPHTVFCHEGEYEDTFYLIAEGHAHVRQYVDEESPRRLLHRLEKGDFFGEMALVQGGPRTATVDTDSPITLLEIHKDALMRVLTRSAPMAIRMVLQVTDRSRDADQKNILDLRGKNLDLRRAYHNLARLDKAKDDFIGVVGHELRTPLTVISGYADMLKSHAAVAEEENMNMLTDGIIVGISRLHAIINNILDVSKLDSAVLKVRRVPTSIIVLVKEIEADFAAVLKERRFYFKSDDLDKLPFIMADSDLLHKVFHHLIMNAIKYTPDGGMITVSGRVIQDETLGDVVEVIVADTGIGIDEEHHELIFEKFYQTGEVRLHSSGTTKFKGGGPGLGLAIARGAVLAHGGKIWVESKGHDEKRFPGSRFCVRLPLDEWDEGGYQPSDDD